MHTTGSLTQSSLHDAKTNGSFGLRRVREKETIEESRVKLTENKLILNQFYFTIYYTPLSLNKTKQNIRECRLSYSVTKSRQRIGHRLVSQVYACLCEQYLNRTDKMNLALTEAPLDTEIWTPQHIGIYYMFVRIRCDMHLFRCKTPQDTFSFVRASSTWYKPRKDKATSIKCFHVLK